MTDTATDQNVVELLKQQHQQIRQLFTEVENASGQKRADAFDTLRRFLAVHETAEEEIVHPAARKAGAGGGSVVDARLTEENEAKQALAELEGMDVDSVQFDTAFAKFRQDVLDHAEHEEREEFPRLLADTDEDRLRRMATTVKAAEKLAPTHPHPGVESRGANVLAGPFAAMLDRTRDALHKMGRND